MRSMAIPHLRARARIGVWLSAAVLFAVPASNGRAGLYLTNDIIADATWSPADSPVSLDRWDFLIASNAAVTIEPGVTVLVGNNLRVEGRIIALGTETDPVVFDELNPGGKWGYLKFALKGGAYRTNIFLHTVFTNMGAYFHLSEQSAHFTNCEFHVENDDSYVIYGYSGLGGGPGRWSMAGNTLNLRMNRTGTSGDIAAIQADGFFSEFRNNAITMISTGDLQEVSALKLMRTNTQNFECGISGNNITLQAHESGSTFSVFGVLCDSHVTGPVSNNTIRMTGARNMTGILKYDAGPIVNNRLAVSNIVAGGSATVVGMDHRCPSAANADVIVNNEITVSADDSGRFVYGVECESGRVRGNVVTIICGGTNYQMRGILQEYYSASIENNTVLLRMTNDVFARGIWLASNYNTNNAITVRNNIVVGSGTANSIGLFKDGACAAVVSNDYNLIHGFETAVSNVTAESHGLTDDPRLAAGTWLLTTNSPALDAGENPGWASAAYDIEGHPRIENGAVDIGADEYFHLPRCVGGSWSNGVCGIQWSVFAGGIYRTQRRANLLEGAWTNCGGAVTAGTYTIETAYTNQGSAAFYRLIRHIP